MTTRTRNRLTGAAGTLLGLALVAQILGLHVRDPALVAAAVVAPAPIALRGALVIGEFVGAAVVSFLFLFGAYLEARSLARTRSYLHGLIEMSPTMALVRRPAPAAAGAGLADGAAGAETDRVEISADDLVEGDVLLLTTGTRIAADARVISGDDHRNRIHRSRRDADAGRQRNHLLPHYFPRRRSPRNRHPRDAVPRAVRPDLHSGGPRARGPRRAHQPRRRARAHVPRDRQPPGRW